MKVLVLSHMFPTKGNPQAGIFVLEQMRALRTLGVEVIAVVPTPWVPWFMRFLPRSRKHWLIPLHTIIDGFTAYYPRVLCMPGGRFFSLYGLFFFLGCRRLITMLVRERRIDIIHAHTIMPDGFAGVLFGRKCNVPVVCTVHGSDINIYPFRNRSTLWAVKWALKRCDWLVTVSHRLKEKVQSLVGPMETEVVHNGADSAKFVPYPKEEARERLNLPLREKIVLFVGNLVPVKGLEFLFRAFAKLNRSDAALYLVGDGELRESLSSQMVTLGIQEATVFVGRRPHEEIPLWLSAASCLVMPSMNEGFPTLLPEAMLCRVPIVATNVGGIPELLMHGETGLMVPHGDVESLVQAIKIIFSERKQVDRMVNQAERAARTEFTWIGNARKMLAVYTAAIGMQNIQ